MNVKSNVQKLGRAMLLPVAAMPLAGLIMRLSADDMLNIPVIGAAGNAVLETWISYLLQELQSVCQNKDKGIPALTGFSDCYLEKGLEIMDPEVNMGILVELFPVQQRHGRIIALKNKITSSFSYLRAKIPIDYGDDSTNNRSCFGLYLAAHPNWD